MDTTRSSRGDLAKVMLIVREGGKAPPKDYSTIGQRGSPDQGICTDPSDIDFPVGIPTRGVISLKKATPSYTLGQATSTGRAAC